eukprot:8475781-Pyramimonas_sp.AAC.1
MLSLPERGLWLGGVWGAAAGVPEPPLYQGRPGGGRALGDGHEGGPGRGHLVEGGGGVGRVLEVGSGEGVGHGDERLRR